MIKKLLARLGTRSTKASKSYETSASFDFETVDPFLKYLNNELELHIDVASLVSFTASVPNDTEKSTEIEVGYKSEKHKLVYHVFKDDPYTSDLYFFSPSKALIDSITASFEPFFETLEM